MSDGWIQALTIIGTLGAALAYVWCKIDKQFDKVDKQFEGIHLELKEIKSDINRLNVQVGKLETRVEERTLRVMHVDKTGTHTHD